jgi:phosphatidylinositol 3-kinase
MSQPHIARSNIKKLEESLIKDNLSSSNNVIEFTLNNKFNANCFNVIADWESYNIDTNNIYEDQHRHLSHSNNLRGSHDITLKPNLQEKEKINKILHYNILTQLNTDDMDLIFKFRYTLVDNNKALIKYLTSVNWKNENEANEVPKLLGMWKDIEVADALKLLGKEKAFNHRIIREYAVNILKSASDDELLTYLLQLVQALRYEQNYSNNDGSESLNKTLLSKTNDNGEGLNLSPLARFLIDRGSKSSVVANYIYWYLRVEVQTTRKDKPNLISNDNINDTNLYLYQTIFKSFMDHLKK